MRHMCMAAEARALGWLAVEGEPSALLNPDRSLESAAAE